MAGWVYKHPECAARLEPEALEAPGGGAWTPFKRFGNVSLRARSDKIILRGELREKEIISVVADDVSQPVGKVTCWAQCEGAGCAATRWKGGGGA